MGHVDVRVHVYMRFMFSITSLVLFASVICPENMREVLLSFVREEYSFCFL